jgi:hypothetical protein
MRLRACADPLGGECWRPLALDHAELANFRQQEPLPQPPGPQP